MATGHEVVKRDAEDDVSIVGGVDEREFVFDDNAVAGRDRGARVDRGDNEIFGEGSVVDDLGESDDDLDNRDNDLDVQVRTECREDGEIGSSVTVAGWAMMGPSWGIGDVGDSGLVLTVRGAGLDALVGVTSEMQLVLIRLEVVVSVMLVERLMESATLVDLERESFIAVMRDSDSFMLEVRGRFNPSCDIATRGSPRLVALVIGRGEGVWMVEFAEVGLCNESSDVLNEWVGLSLQGDPGVALPVDTPPILTRDEVDPSFTPHLRAGEDWDGYNTRCEDPSLEESGEVQESASPALFALNARSSSDVKLTVVDVCLVCPPQPEIIQRKHHIRTTDNTKGYIWTVNISNWSNQYN